MSAAALSFAGVRKRYGRRMALDGLDLEVPSGACLALVGSNGAGKTTLMAAAAGLLRTHGGAIDVLGQGPFDPGRHCGRVALLPQDARQPLHLNPLEWMVYLGCLQGLRPPEARARSAALLADFHLADRAASPIRTLSHGMRRRLSMAQAFLGRPELVLLDEPLNGLDPREAAHARELLQGWRSTCTLVISSHNLHELESLCDHVAFVEKGRRVSQGTLDAVTARHGHVRYLLAPGSPPPPDGALAAVLPAAVCAWSPADSALDVRYPAGLCVEQVNALALPALLALGCRIAEVRRGAALERAYLDATDAPPARPVSP